MVAEKAAAGPHVLPRSPPLTLSLTYSSSSFSPSEVFPVLPLDQEDASHPILTQLVLLAIQVSAQV